jgi:hypothetical protein
MTKRHLITSLLLTSGGLALVAAVVQAQAIPASCQPVLAARRKMFTVPHRSSTTDVAPKGGAAGKASNGIFTADAIYIQIRGAWKKSPMTPKDMLEQMESNLREAKALACKQLGDEPVDGTPAAVYTAHSESENGKADAKLWVAKGTGLLLRDDEAIDDGTTIRHRSTRYDYKDVRAPAGVP